MTAEIEHIHFLCADPEASATFFKTYFQASEIERVKLPDWLIIRLRIGPTIIALSPKRGDQALGDPAPGPRRGFAHIGLTVSGLDALVGRMRADGVTVTVDPFDIAPTVRGAYVLAPDAIELELLEPKRAS